jgi:hypothetical protein
VSKVEKKNSLPLGTNEDGTDEVGTDEDGTNEEKQCAETPARTNEENQCAETPALLTQPYDVTPVKIAKKLVIFDDGTAKTKDGTNWIKCERKTFEFTRGVNKGSILVRYYPSYEAEPSVDTMQKAHLK